MMNIDLWKDRKDLLIMLAIHIYIYREKNRSESINSWINSNLFNRKINQV